MIKVLQYFAVWDLARWLRLGLAVFMFAAGAFNMQFLPVLLGAFFLYQAITNTGCAGGSCEIPSAKKQNFTNKEKDNLQ